MPLPRLGIKGGLTLGVLVVLLALLAWDHSLDGKGWVPSLGANLITMLVTVVLLDALFKERQKRGAAAILCTSFITVGNYLAQVAQAYKVGLPNLPQLWEWQWDPIIRHGKTALEGL